LTQKGENRWIEGEKLNALPSSMASLIGEENEEESEIFVKRMPTQWVVAGEKSLKLEVK